MANQKKQPVYEEQPETTGVPGKILGAVACFGVALLMGYISLAAPMVGTAMGAIRDVLRGIGGSVSVLIALFFVWIGVLLALSARGRRIRIINIIANVLLFLCAFAAVQLFSSKNVFAQISITSFANFVNKSYQYGKGGGALGALLAYPLYTYLGQWGGLIALLLVALLCLLATGRAQSFYRWTQRHAEEGQHYVEQKRNIRKVEQMFDYDEFDDPAPQSKSAPRDRRSPRPQPQEPPRRVQTKPTRKVSDPEREYMVIDAAEPPKPKRAAPKKKLYKETIDPEAAPSNPIEEQPSDIEIPKPLR